MRIRTLLTLGLGAALGAGATYLLDPDHGAVRRADARARAAQQAREQAEARARDAVRAASGYARAAAEGFRTGREDAVRDA